MPFFVNSDNFSVINTPCAMANILGKTKDTGYQAGIRHTFPVSLHSAWEYLFSEKGIQAWLGYYHEIKWVRGNKFVTKYGNEICVRVYRELSHVRIGYRKKGWEKFSTIQLRLIQAKTGTTISFHQEKLAGPEQREEMKRHWEKVLEAIKTGLDKKK